LTCLGAGPNIPAMSVPSPSVGQVFGHYRLIEKIGSGGMGLVYRAHDERLDRDVALKLLHPGVLAAESIRNRLRSEALAVARLNHPNIAMAFDFGTEAGVDYLVTEYVPGTTLQDKIKAGRLSIKTAVELAVQLARGLEAAHREGIAHRDLKPANLRVTPDGTLKILDFGIAGLMEAESKVTQTVTVSRSTAVSGTVPYMAPEQLKGEAPDPRMDIWAAGTVLYEMLTGRPAFPEKQSARLIDSILHQDPVPPSRLDPRVAPELQAVVMKTLDKNPERRYQSARELRVDLTRTLPSAESTRVAIQPARRVRWPGWRILAGIVAIAAIAAGAVLAVRSRLLRPAAPGQILLVILPFESVDHDAKANALGLGLTETLTAKLGEIAPRSALQLISTRDIEAQSIRSAEEARRQFGTDLVLEGSLQQSGALIRVNCSLVDARSRRQIGARTVTAPQADVFDLEDKVVSEVAQILSDEIRPKERVNATAARPARPIAYEHYLRGRGFLQEYQKPESIDSAIAELQAAVGAEPGYAEAYAAMGQAYLTGYEQYDRGNEWVDKAADACEKAIAAGPQLPDSHACLASVDLGRGQYQEAVAHFQRARELGSTSELTFDGLAQAYNKAGNASAAEATYKQAIELQPRYWGVYSALGRFYFQQARFADAAAAFRKAIQAAPDNYRSYSNLGAMYLLQGNYTEAIDLLKHSIQLRPNRDAYANLGAAYFWQRRYPDAADACREALKLDNRDWLSWGNLGEALYWTPDRRAEAQEDYGKAIQLAKSKLEVNPRDATTLAFVGSYYAMSGERQRALRAIQRAVELAPQDADVQFRAAITYSHFGETEQTLAHLRSAARAGTSAATIRDTPDFDGLRQNPRFQALIRH
jgi:tetratricopeptide (TPR) repeat protein/TolB-like protein